MTICLGNQPTSIIFVVVGLIVVVIAIFLIKKSKREGDEESRMGTSLSKALVSDQADEMEPAL